LFLADSRLALVLFNEVRRRALTRMFGVSAEHANLLTVVIALTAGQAAATAVRHAVRVPLRITGTDAAWAGLLLREGALGVAGAPTRAVPHPGALLAVGVLGGAAVPGVRRAARGLRAAERRVREQRISRYRAVAGA
jgi:hypothetical protein